MQKEKCQGAEFTPHPDYLNLAAYLGNFKICRLLLRFGASTSGVSMVMSESYGAPKWKFERKKLIYILSRTPSFVVGTTPLTPLYLAALGGVSLRVVKLLVEAHGMFDLSQIRTNGDVVVAACAGGNAAIVDYLLANDFKVGDAATCLRAALHGGSVAVVRVLSLRGALPSGSNQSQHTNLLRKACKRRLDREIVAILLQHRIGDPAEKKVLSVPRQSYRKSPLQYAAEYDNMELVEMLCESISPGTVRDLEIFQSAVANGNLAVLKLLLEKSEKTDQVTRVRMLHLAIKHDRRQIIEFLMANYNGDKSLVTMGASSGKTALGEAAQSNNVDMMEYLLSQGAMVTPNARERMSNVMDPFTCAVKGVAMDAIKFLLERGAIEPNNAWALHIALTAPSDANAIGAEVCKYLLSTETNPDWRLLGAMHAVKSSSLPVLKLLLGDERKDDWLTSSRGDSLLHLACAVGTQPEAAAVTKFLIEKGANPLLRNEDGWTPVQIAVRKGNRRHVKICIKAHPNLVFYLFPMPTTRLDEDLWGRNHSGNLFGPKDVDKKKREKEKVSTPEPMIQWTLLHHVANTGHVRIAELLIKKGAHVSALTVDEIPETAFSLTCKSQAEIVDVLLAAGYSVTPNELRDVLFAACRSKRVATIKYLGQKFLIDNWKDFVDEEGNTLLHAAALVGCFDLIIFFSAKGFNDRSLKNKQGQTVHDLILIGSAGLSKTTPAYVPPLFPTTQFPAPSPFAAPTLPSTSTLYSPSVTFPSTTSSTTPSTTLFLAPTTPTTPTIYAPTSLFTFPSTSPTTTLFPSLSTPTTLTTPTAPTAPFLPSSTTPTTPTSPTSSSTNLTTTNSPTTPSTFTFSSSISHTTPFNF